MRLALPMAVAVSLRLLAQSVPSPDFAVDAGLVLISATAVDRNGNMVSDLRIEDFVLEDNGKPRAIENMWREDTTPLTIGLIVDTSWSQLPFIEQHQRTLTQFLGQVLRAQDQAFLLSIPGRVQMAVDLTHSVNDLQKGVNNLQSRTGVLPPFGEPCPEQTLHLLGHIWHGPQRTLPCTSPLWNSVYDAASLRMLQAEGRKALILWSDGMDVKSQHTLTDTIEAAQRAATTVYTIRAGNLLSSLGGGKGNLSRLANETGGRAYSATDETGSKKIFDEIEAELRNTYILAFTLPPSARDGKFHKLKVTTKRRGVTIRTRAGYFADR